MKPKKKYTEKDYEYVLNRIVESWSDGTLPDTYNISLILGGIIIIFSWIKSNWEYAKSRAEEDLIIKMKGGKIKWR
ncbi:MAG TPA: hypothetical protein VMZ91_09915 [Candidatus Paceibacterota bacterium]|nr:hypothetical protein [Candidatus Paceibacterota bacterium]